MTYICMEEELSKFDLEGKWNDYIGMQKEIIRVLKKNGYFDCQSIQNDETGMEIRITPKGIKETFGKGNRFQTLPKLVKKYKVCTVSVLPELIKEANLIKDNVQNYYSETGYEFAYFRSSIYIDRELHMVRIAIKKKINTNHFYIHHIDTEKVLNYSAHLKRR